ncbi:unnamed protein product [Mucor hiemalis]
MPAINPNLDVNVRVSVSKRFVNKTPAKNLLLARHDWNTPGLSFQGSTTARSTVNDVVMYDVILDDSPGITLTLRPGCLKYLGRLEARIKPLYDDIQHYSHVEVRRDPLYQIRSTIDAFNDRMAYCITPGKYLVIDESMNQWLGTGMPNLKKVPRKPHPIGQEFKTLADHHTYCILRMDTVSDPLQKEFDNEPGMLKMMGTIKRLVKPWFDSGRTVIADSWFGSPAMIAMLSELGLYSIMQVCKRRYWPRGMPTTDIVEQVAGEVGSHFTMKKVSGSSKYFTCAYRDQKVKAFVSSCGTTRLTGSRTFLGSGGNVVTITRPAVVDEYERHKSSVDAANNLRDNKISYHDVIATERWEMRFFGFFLGICEANAYSAYRVFARDGKTTSHSEFKDTLTWELLQHCVELKTPAEQTGVDEQRVLRSNAHHSLVTMVNRNGKRSRLSCRTCYDSGKSGVRVEKSCSCDPGVPMCNDCFLQHYSEFFTR